jgi:4-hydroxy-tetrahydrodipicolinate reductase
VIDLVIHGVRGRMGSALARLAAGRTDVRIVAGIGRTAGDADEAARCGCHRIVGVAEAGAAVAQADVVIDFSRGDGTAALLAHAGDALAGRGLVVGTTGLDMATEQLLEQLSRRAGVLQAANFSVGVNLLLVLAEQAAALLGADAYDIEIVEAHHGGKVDAPSGTALALGEAVAKGRRVALESVRRDGRSGHTGARPTGEIGMHAVRGGTVIGEHQLMFLGGRERIELRHEALDRSLFAEGALEAAIWLAGQPAGRYGMRDVLGL